jgi:hypothetical protein
VKLVEGSYDNFVKDFTQQQSSSVRNSEHFKNRFNLKPEKLAQILS